MIIQLISLDDKVLLEVASPNATQGYTREQVLNYLESNKQQITLEDGSEGYQIHGYLLYEDFRIEVLE